MTSTRYVIVCPVRNEEQFLPSTIQSLEAQSIPPHRFIIVDDGSTDGTRAIAENAAARFSWIRVVVRRDRGSRQAGQGVVEAFYEGYDQLRTSSFDYLVKLDGDVSFEHDYFERCFEKFAKLPKLGIGGGTVCKQGQDGLEPESTVDPSFHVRGATKIYRAECWHQIGGLLNQPGWDTLDEVKANMLGWLTGTFQDISLLHHRPAGGAYGAWNNWLKNGLANYIAGYHPLFMAVKCLKRLPTRPALKGAIGLGCGFLGGYLRGVRQVDDPELIRYFRQQQMRRLLFRPSLWDQKTVDV